MQNCTYLLWNNDDTHPVLMGCFSEYQLAVNTLKWYRKNVREISCSRIQRMEQDTINIQKGCQSNLIGLQSATSLTLLVIEKYSKI